MCDLHPPRGHLRDQPAHHRTGGERAGCEEEEAGSSPCDLRDLDLAALRGRPCPGIRPRPLLQLPPEEVFPGGEQFRGQETGQSVSGVFKKIYSKEL